MDINLKNILENYLNENEELLWIDSPKKGFRIKFEDLMKIPFLICFLCLSIFFITISIQKNSFSEFSFISILMLIGGLYIGINNYIIEILKSEKTIYGLTNKRVLFYKSNELKFLQLEEIKKISFIDHPFKYIYGSVIFGEPENIFGSNDEPFNSSYLLGHKSGINFKTDEYSFEFIKNVKEVYNLIQSKILEAKSSKTLKCQ